MACPIPCSDGDGAMREGGLRLHQLCSRLSSGQSGPGWGCIQEDGTGSSCLLAHSCHLVGEGCTLRASCPADHVWALSQSGCQGRTLVWGNLKEEKCKIKIVEGLLKK